MAWANLMRNKLKTILVVLSLALSIVMLNGVYGFTRGFSMDGFLEKFVISDFLVADADYFKYSGWGDVSPSLVESLKHLDGFEDGGYVGYFKDYRQLQVTKKSYVDWMTNRFNQFSQDELDPELLALPDDAMTEMHLSMYALDDYTVSKLEVVEGSLEGWKEPGNIVQVILTDDYGNPIMDQAMYEVGDQVEIISSTDYTVSEDGMDVTRNSQMEESYTVIATAVIPNVMTTRGHGYPEFAVSGESIPKEYESFVTDMVYLADFTEEGTAAAEQFVQDYTEKIEPEMAYESKGKYAGNYEQFQMMFWMVGGSLSFIIGLVGLFEFCQWRSDQYSFKKTGAGNAAEYRDDRTADEKDACIEGNPDLGRRAYSGSSVESGCVFRYDAGDRGSVLVLSEELYDDDDPGGGSGTACGRDFDPRCS